MMGGMSTQGSQTLSRQEASRLHVLNLQQVNQQAQMQPQQQTHQPDNIFEAQRKKSKEIIHSGHFMVSDFEAEGRDDEDDEVLIPVPEESADPTVLVGSEVVGVNPAGDLAGVNEPGNLPVVVARPKISDSTSKGNRSSLVLRRPLFERPKQHFFTDEASNGPSVTIDQSLTKLFNCMTLAYSSKLTSPRWKNFKGLRLQWKDKIRLNNLIWRCWHMQFIEKRDPAVCQFASPLDCDQHNKPEAVVLEGKYWKRRLATVTAEYKKWRIFFKNKIMGRTSKDLNDLFVSGELDNLDWTVGPRSNGSCNSGTGSLTLDDDFYMDFSDTLFSSLTSNQPFPFPNPREIAKGAGLADFIQPGLIQLQPNLDDFMDTFEPLHELLSGRLPPVEEEIVVVEEAISPAANSLSQQQHSIAVRQDYVMPYSSTSASAGISADPATPAPSLSIRSASQPPLLNSIVNFLPMEVSSPESEYLDAQQQTQPYRQQPQQISNPSTSSQDVVYNYINRPASSSAGVPQQVAFFSSAEHEQLLSTPAFGSTQGVTYDPSQLSVSFQRQPTDQQGFAVPTGKPRSRSRSGSAVVGSSTVISPVGSSLSNDVPSTSSRGKGKTSNSSSNSSPARLLSEQLASAPRTGVTERNRSRIRSGPDLQTPTTAASIALPQQTATVKNRTILPDNSTLLAQLLTGSHSSSPSGATLLLTTDSVSTSRIPLFVPVQSNDPSSGLPPMEKATVTLLPATFTTEFVGVDVHNPLKRESSALQTTSNHQNVVEEQAPPVSAQGSTTKAGTERVQYKEHRRVCHINAEQKRRCNIKNGFDTLQSLLPGSSGGSGSNSGGGSSASGSGSISGHGKSSEVSKAAMLHRGAEYIRQLRQERQQQQEEMEQLKQNIESLNAAISGCQALLPATGAPVARQRGQRMKELFDEWVRARTLQNWKFWIFSILIQPLMESFSAAVSSVTYEDLWQSVLSWVDQHCSLMALRPVVMNSLRHLSKTTDILTDPSRLPDEATRAVCSADGSVTSSTSRSSATSTVT